MRITKGWHARLTSLVAATLLGSMALSGVAYADDISNDLDADVDAVAEVMSLNVGGDEGTTNLYVTPRNGDGKNGCNLNSGSLVLSVASSNTSVATISPSSVTFTSCGDKAELTIKAVAQGTSNITVAQTSNTTGGSFSLAPATFAVNVAPPSNAAPTIAVLAVTEGSSYAKESVPTATCSVTDAEDGNFSFSATLSAITGDYATDGIGLQTASCSFTDKGGLKAAASKTYSIVDPSAPVITYALTPTTPDGLNGWYKSVAALTWTVAEPESPNSLSKAGCVDQTITADQAATTYSCSATSAGGTAAEQSVTIKRDATAPVIDSATPDREPNSNGWYNAPVTVTFTASDNLSGLDGVASRTATTGTGGLGVGVESPAFTDLAGNVLAAGHAAPSFNIDTQAPNEPTVSVSPAPNAEKWNNSNVTVSFKEAGDNGASGVDSCTGAVTVSAETLATGQVVSGTCLDAAGNESAAAGVTVKLDKTRPVIVQTAVAGTQGDNGWYTSDVEVTFSASDALSGLVAGTVTPEKVKSSGEGSAIEVSSSTYTDNAGNSTSPLVPEFKIDKSGPTLTVSGGPTAQATYFFGSVPAAPSCTAVDLVSGMDGLCGVSGYSTNVGTQTLTITAKDLAGNSTTVQRTYVVSAWTLNGFYAPVDIGKDAKGNQTINTVKAGSTVPLKFEAFAGTTELTALSTVKSFTAVKAGTVAGPEDAIEQYSTGGTSLRYDSTGGQFIQNWQVPKGAVGETYLVTLTLQDGSTTSALFKLK